MKAFKTWMVMGAVAAMVGVTGCREQNRERGSTTPGMEGTGGSGQGTTPHPSDNMGGTGGTGQEIQGTDAGTGGSGMMDNGYDAGSRMMDDARDTMDRGTHTPEGQQ